MTVNEAIKNPAEFLYLFAADAFLSKIDAKSAAIIRKKRTNQSFLLNKICVEQKAVYANVVSSINYNLQKQFGHTGTECLKILAEGGEIAGKNWSAGVYGVGATTYEGFSGTDITVDKSTGKLLKAGKEISGQTAIYGKNNTTYTALVDGVTYTSQYKGGFYSAGLRTTKDGVCTNASGAASGLSDFSSIWSSIQSFSPMIESLIGWLTSLFPSLFAGRDVVTTYNTVPSQSDGFVQSGSTLDIGTVGIFAGITALVYAFLKKGKKR